MVAAQFFKLSGLSDQTLAKVEKKNYMYGNAVWKFCYLRCGSGQILKELLTESLLDPR